MTEKEVLCKLASKLVVNGLRKDLKVLNIDYMHYDHAISEEDEINIGVRVGSEESCYNTVLYSDIDAYVIFLLDETKNNIIQVQIQGKILDLSEKEIKQLIMEIKLGDK